MAFQFPVNPVIGQVFNPTPGVTYKWDGAGWVPTSSSLLSQGDADLRYMQISNLYVVGDLFLSLSTAYPGDRFGGVWQLVSQGRFLVGANGALGPVGTTGGEYTHLLTQSELPVTNVNINTGGRSAAHTHAYVDNQHNFETASAPGLTVQGPAGPNMATIAVAGTTSSETEDHVHNVNFAFGGNSAHNITPPYVCVYVWQRTA